MKPFAVAAALLIATSAAGQTCASYDTVAETLTDANGEYLTMTMLTPNGQAIEIWHNHLTQTWTAISVDPEGVACLLSRGRGVVFTVRLNI